MKEYTYSDIIKILSEGNISDPEKWTGLIFKAKTKGAKDIKKRKRIKKKMPWYSKPHKQSYEQLVSAAQSAGMA